MKPEQESGYFNQEYTDSRHKVVEEYRELAKQKLPIPEQDWSVIWALSGPETTLEENAPPRPKESHKAVHYNMTKRRFETALQVARSVTARRCGKKIAEVTPEDIEKQGPVVYWNGSAAQNDYFKEFIKNGELMKNYGFPGSKIQITESRDIEHTDHQFEDFPKSLISKDNKVVIVSDFEHWPRIKRYLIKHQDKFTAATSVFYPAQPSELPVKIALQEIRKIHPYTKQGILPKDEVLEDDK